MVNPIIAFDEPQNDEARAKRMAAQYQQPVTGPRGAVTSAGVPSAPKVPGIADGLAGGAKIIAGGTALPFAAGIDAARSGIASLAGGDPNTLPGGRSRYADSASSLLAQGIDQASAASDRLKSGARDLLGVKPQASSIGADMPSQAPVADAPAQQSAPIPNSQPAQAATPAITADMPGQVGTAPSRPVSGGGTFSVVSGGREGMNRNLLAAEIMRQTLRDNAGGIQVAGITDMGTGSDRRFNQRLALQQAANPRPQAQQQRQGIGDGIAAMQAAQTEQQARQLALDSQLRLDNLAAMLADPTVSSDQRETARSAYTSLSTPAKDRYQSQDIIIGRDENGRDIRGSQLIDVTTGRPVSAGGVSRRMSVTRQEVEQAAKEDGVSIDDYIRALTAQGVAVS